MRQLIISLALALSALSVSAQSTAIEGNWGTQQQAGPINFDMTFSIAKDLVTLTNVCSGFGATVTAQVVVKSAYSEKTLTILESKQDQKSVNGLDCNVSAAQDSMNYTIQGDMLVFTHDGAPDSFSLKRKQ